MNTSKTEVDTDGRDSLDIEMTEKVAMTISAIVGACSFDGSKTTAEQFQKFKKHIMSDDFGKDKEEWLIANPVKRHDFLYCIILNSRV